VGPWLLRLTEKLINVALAISDMHALAGLLQKRCGLPHVFQPADVLIAVLLGLVVLFVLVLGFAAKNAVPDYMDEIRLMLNLGLVRENERLVFNGVLWLVENLTFFTILRNPALRGGMIRMPITQLLGMLSRPATEDEPCFPSEEGDWVLLDPL
jgi:hypothetical protein